MEDSGGCGVINIIRHFGEYSIIRFDYIQICDGDICAAQLLSAFEHWTIERLSDDRAKDTLLNIHVDTIIGCVCGTFGRDRVLSSLINQEFVEQLPSSNPLGWTFICRLNVEKVQQSLDEIQLKTGAA